MMNNYTKY